MCKYKNILIHLDSDHTKQRIKELNIYSTLIKKNNYLIVGDTIIEDILNKNIGKGLGVKCNNPKNALTEFLKKK